MNDIRNRKIEAADRVRNLLTQWIDHDGPTMIDLDVYDQYGLASFRYAELGDILTAIADPDRWDSLARQQAAGGATGCIAYPADVLKRWPLPDGVISADDYVRLIGPTPREE